MDNAVDANGAVTLFLCGDVMTGRGIDQILPHPGDPRLFEPYVRSAVEYVRLAERASGPIPRPVDFAYPWGDALAEMSRFRPHARIVNLETAVTRSDEAWPGKGIHYRMHPANVPCLAAAGIDCCVLANNHVLDWGRAGLDETVFVLRRAGIRTAGAGSNAAQAASVARIDVAGDRRVLVYACATEDSGVPGAWSATADRSGVALLRDLSSATVDGIVREIRAQRRSGDIVVLSIHWGGNWGHRIAPEQRAFAHDVIERARRGHRPRSLVASRQGDRGASRASRPLRLRRLSQRLRGHLRVRAIPFGPAPHVLPDASRPMGGLLSLAMSPMRTRRLRIERAPEEGARWLAQTLSREGRALGTRAAMQPDGSLALAWTRDASAGTR